MPPAGAAETLRIGGTGAALGLAGRLAEAFGAEEPGVTVSVLPSLGTSGALRALADGAIEIALAARPLKPAEVAGGLTDRPLARTPFVLVTSRPEAASIARDELAALYADPAPHWADGELLRVVLRPESDTDSALLAENFPGMTAALALARQRAEVPLAVTDQENLQLAEKISGSLTATTLAQLATEGADLTPLAIDGVRPDVEALEAGRYRLSKEFHVATRQSAGGAVARFLAFLDSERARDIVRRSGALPLP